MIDDAAAMSVVCSVEFDIRDVNGQPKSTAVSAVNNIVFDRLGSTSLADILCEQAVVLENEMLSEHTERSPLLKFMVNASLLLDRFQIRYYRSKVCCQTKTASFQSSSSLKF